MELFNFQYAYNPLYKTFADSLHVDPEEVFSVNQIPFLPIECFKKHIVKTGEFDDEVIFESSGTTNSTRSKHYIKDVDLYKKSFNRGFEKFYGDPGEWCIVALLPTPEEAKNSSLVTMVNELIRRSMNPLSGFYLNDHQKLHQALLHNEILKQPTILFGLTYALLDFAEKYKMQLRHTVIIETGGMKGRREEMIKEDLYSRLQYRLGVNVIHSEYGMTELMSQAYSKSDGLFKCVPWMEVLIRDEDDPLNKTLLSEDKKPITGLINIIDLANIHSCAFIATDDIGKLHHTGYFEVLGRSDFSDLRGCNLLLNGI